MLIKKLIHKFGDSQLLGTLTFAIEADIFAINFFHPLFQKMHQIHKNKLYFQI